MNYHCNESLGPLMPHRNHSATQIIKQSLNLSLEAILSLSPLHFPMAYYIIMDDLLIWILYYYYLICPSTRSKLFSFRLCPTVTFEQNDWVCFLSVKSFSQHLDAPDHLGTFRLRSNYSSVCNFNMLHVETWSLQFRYCENGLFMTWWADFPFKWWQWNSLCRCLVLIIKDWPVLFIQCRFRSLVIK